MSKEPLFIKRDGHSPCVDNPLKAVHAWPAGGAHTSVFQSQKPFQRFLRENFLSQAALCSAKQDMSSASLGHQVTVMRMNHNRS